MRKKKTFSKGLIAAILVFLTFSAGACLVNVEKADSEKVARSFHEARKRIARISASPSHAPHRLVCLVYDSTENKLVRVILPYWMVKRGILNEGERHTGYESEKSGIHFQEKVLREVLSEMPAGLLIEVSGEEEKVLIWLE